MIHRRQKAYILAIHGCPVWPVLGLDTAALPAFISSHFSNFFAQGGEFTPTLKDVPQITQTIDITGGLAQMGGVGFSVVDSGGIAEFFFANRRDSPTTVLTAIVDRIQTAVTVQNTINFTDGDIVYLPGETCRIGSIDSGTDMSFDLRSMFSAFPEGPWSLRFDLIDNASYGNNLVKGGHWQHAGRWVCLYEASTGPLGTYDTVRRLYAGNIEDVSVDGLDIAISTSSVMDILKAPLILQHDLKMVDSPNWYCFPVLWMDRQAGAALRLFSFGNSILSGRFQDVLRDLLDTSEEADGRPWRWRCMAGYMGVRHEAGTSAPADTQATSANCSPGIVRFFNVTDNVTELNTGNTIEKSSSGERGAGNIATQLITPGYTFRLENQVAMGSVTECYFSITMQDKVICYVPCKYDGDKWTAQGGVPDLEKWYDGEENEYQEPRDKAFPINPAALTLRMVGSPATGTENIYDMRVLLGQMMIATGEALFPEDLGILDYWTSYCIPKYLVRFEDFAAIGYPMQLFIEGDLSIESIFEGPLKMAGQRCYWSHTLGQVRCNTMDLALEEQSVGKYTLLNQSTTKPSTVLGYQAPLTSITHKWEKLNVEYSYKITAPPSRYRRQAEVVMVDKYATEQYPYSANIARNQFDWGSNLIPSTVVNCDEAAGDVGDCVLLTNLYVPTWDGYGIENFPCIQTEVMISRQLHQARLFLAGGVISQEYGVLAPAGEIDLTVGTYGIDAGNLVLTDNAFPQYLAEKLESYGPFTLIVRHARGFVRIPGCTLIPAALTPSPSIALPAGYAWPAGFFGVIQTIGSAWVTVDEYWTPEEWIDA